MVLSNIGQSLQVITLVTGDVRRQWQFDTSVVGDTITPGAQSITAGLVSLQAMAKTSQIAYMHIAIISNDSIIL